MQRKQQHGYLYRAHAVGLGGFFEQPFQEPIPVQAPNSLPVSGGFGAARVENFRFRDAISARSIQTQVVGDEDEEAFNTLTVATIEGLNVLDMVTADAVVARISSRHNKKTGVHEIITLGSAFDNLRIAGKPVHLDLNQKPFCTYATFKQIKAKCEPLAEHNGISAYTLVSKIGGLPPTAKGAGHRIEVPQFGVIHLAELYITERSRRLIMIRAELGCPHEARFACAEVDGNGSPWPV
ncbi:MAG: hypothetical protein GY953_16900 [bacterium]|nr:hypothetical protein [bacterium]